MEVYCNKCQEYKHPIDFSPRASIPRGYHPWCKQCSREDKEKRARKLGQPAHIPFEKILFKMCKDCKQVKSVDHFNQLCKFKKYKCYAAYCKLCKSVRNRKYHENNANRDLEFVYLREIT